MVEYEQTHLNESLQNTPNPTHVIYFDCLRLVALFLVVMLHVAGRELLFPGGACFWKAWGISNAFDSLCRCAVPVFVMISGALFLGREIPVNRLYSKYVIRIVRVFAIWTVFYALDALFLGFDQDDVLLTAEFVEICFKGHYHLWFLPMIAGLYLIVPFLRRIAHDVGLCRLFLLVGFVFAFLVPPNLGNGEIACTVVGRSMCNTRQQHECPLFSWLLGLFHVGILVA